VGTQGVGLCKAGTQTCNPQGTAYGPCAGEVTPKPENCATAADEDCNGSAPPCVGSLLWAKGFGGLGDQEGNTVRVDAAGNVFLGGYTAGPIDFGCGTIGATATYDTPLIVKFDAAGNCLWNKLFPISGMGSTDQVKALAVDAAGNIFVTLTFFGGVDLGGGMLVAAGQSDVAVARFDPNGNYVWAKQFGNASPQNSTSLGLDSQGNVIVAGRFNGAIDFGGGALTAVGGTDVFVAKLSPMGAHLWSQRFGDGANQVAQALAVDGSDNVLIAGSAGGSIDFGGGALVSAGLSDAFVAKLSPTGAHLWSKMYGDAQDQSANAVIADAQGNVLVTGSFNGGPVDFGGTILTSQAVSDAFVVKLDAAGNHLWSKAIGGPNNQNTFAIGADASGNVLVAGLLDGSADFGAGVKTSAGGGDIFIAKYDPAGAYLWEHDYGDATLQFPRALTIDAAGDVIVTGLTNGLVDFGAGALCGNGGEDIFLVKLGP
jgi:hypothetical protein